MAPNAPDAAFFKVELNDEPEWHSAAVITLRNCKSEQIRPLQRLLLNFMKLGKNVDASDIIHAQLEILEASVRAGHRLELDHFLIKGS